MIYVELKQGGNMKKYEVKGWVMVFLFLFTLLWMVSCRTVDKTIHQTKEEKKESVFNDLKFDNNIQTSSELNEIERQERLLKELISSLQIGFNGQTEDDKLSVELIKTLEGLKFEVSGSGTANYQQTETLNIEELESKLYKRQDSLHNQQMAYLQDFTAEFLQELKAKDKEVKVKGFTFGSYLIFGVLAVVGFILGWIARRINFKNLLKAV